MVRRFLKRSDYRCRKCDGVVHYTKVDNRLFCKDCYEFLDPETDVKPYFYRNQQYIFKELTKDIYVCSVCNAKYGECNCMDKVYMVEKKNIKAAIYQTFYEIEKELARSKNKPEFIIKNVKNKLLTKLFLE